MRILTNYLIKYFNFASYFFLFLIILTVDYFIFRKFLGTNRLINIFCATIHSFISIWAIRIYLKDISLKNYFASSDEVFIFIKKYSEEFFLLISLFFVSFLIGIIYFDYIYDHNLTNLFYERTTLVALPKIINPLNDLIVGLIFSSTCVFCYLVLRSAFISKYIALILTFYFISSPTNIYNLIPSPFRDYFKATIIFFILIFFINLIKNRKNISNEKIFIFFISFGIFFGLWIRSDFLIYVPLFVFFLIFNEIKKGSNFSATSLFQNIFPFLILCLPHIIAQLEMVGDNFAIASSFIITQNHSLGIENGLYDSGYIFIDEYLRNLINIDKDYTFSNIVYFPLDFLQKILATQINVLNLSFKFSLPPPGLYNEMIDIFYMARFASLSFLHNIILIVFYICILILIFKKPQTGFMISLLFIFIISYPLIQNQIRHYFYIEIISLWSVGYIIETITTKLRDNEKN